MRNFLNEIIKYVYKPRCYFCGSSRGGERMCAECFLGLRYNSFEPIDKILNMHVYSAGSYEHKLLKLIRGVKYHQQKGLAFYQAKFMWAYFNQLKIGGIYQVVPVPMFKQREKERGYNHMEIVCEEFCKLSGFVPNYELIYRVKDTKPQYRLTKEERMENLNAAFRVEGQNLIKDKKVLIIDDILTTGSTLESMIRVFKADDLITTGIICLTTAKA